MSLLATAFVVGASPASAYDITISANANKQVRCTHGETCTPTGLNANLNTKYLEKLLKKHPVDVMTGRNGTQPGDVIVMSALTWGGKNALTFDAYHSIRFGARVTAKGLSGFYLITNDGSTDGTLVFDGGGVTIENISTKFTIDGKAYALADSVGGLASAVANSPSGLIAFAGDYDASEDGTYQASPVQTTFTGVLQGLGNVISNLSINEVNSGDAGLFVQIGTGGLVENLGLANVYVEGSSDNTGALAGDNSGMIENVFSSGIVFTSSYDVGGLVGYNSGGTVLDAYSSAEVTGSYYDSATGGLIGLENNNGVVSESFATGWVTDQNTQPSVSVGGLIGSCSSGSAMNSYALGSATGGGYGNVGGLVGFGYECQVSDSYSTGVPAAGQYVGGLIGYVNSGNTFTNTYWDTTTSGISCGAGSDCNETGITGLTTTQFQSELPNGFSDVIWAETSNINGGLPYLVSNVPPNNNK
jgi:hypothetical protein